MTVVVYPAVVMSAEPTSLRARFVDFPGVEVGADSAGELIRLARERLGAELQRLENQGDTWPEPTPVTSLNVPQGGSAVLVDVSVEDTPIRLTISLGERLLKRIDEDAAARSMTRSGYLALGARRMLGEVTAPFGGVGGETGKRIQEEIEAVGRRLNEALGPESPVGRGLADLDAYALDGLRRLGDEVRSAMRPRRRPAAPPDVETTREAVEPQRAEG
jgi:HicB_like antitoxin of bacterial toxin-antitoxin system